MNFIQEQSAQVSQMTLYGYLKTRMGAKHVLMFEEEEYLKSINLAKWNIYSIALIDCVFYCSSFLYNTKKLKNIENASGRKRNVPKFSARTLDVDIVLQIDEDEIVFESDEIRKYSFVSKPLKEII